MTLNTTQGSGITLEKTYEKLATRALQWQLGNAAVLEREDPSGQVNQTAKSLHLYGYGTLTH
jgi:hypothetical protein